MSETPLPEPLEDFVQKPPGLPSPPDFQDRLLHETMARLPRPRSWRRWTAAACMVAALVLLAAYLANRPRDVEPAPTPEIVKGKHEPPPQPAPPATPSTPERPLDLEWRAFDADDDRQKVRLYLRAGDLYFEQNQDVESALRCYGEALRYSDAQGLETNANDNWLVMALKRDLRKEP